MVTFSRSNETHDYFYLVTETDRVLRGYKTNSFRDFRERFLLIDVGFSDGCGSRTGSRNCSEIADASKEKFSLFTIALLFNLTLRAQSPRQ